MAPKKEKSVSNENTPLVLHSLENHSLPYKYKVTIQTGNRRGSGTTAQVFCYLLGSLGKTKSISVPGQFNTSSVVNLDIYLESDIGNISQIVIGHDKDGDQGVGWFLEHVKIESDITGELYFPVQKWLGRTDFCYTENLPSVVKVQEASLIRPTQPSLGMRIPLNIVCGAAAYPAPSKVKDGMRGVIKATFGYAGEDAYSITPVVPFSSEANSRLSTEQSSFLVCALADGVYSWRKQGIDAGKFSRSLVRSIQLKAQEVVSIGITTQEETDIGIQSTKPNPKKLLAFAEDALGTSVKGSSTCIVCCVDGTSGCLDVANIGDSGVMVLRKGIVVFKSEEQEHSFGYPYQMPFDKADNSVEYSLDLFAGDLLIIGSDGVFDNLSEEDVENIVRDTIQYTPDDKSSLVADTMAQHAVKQSTTTSKALAQQLCYAAFQNSLNKQMVTPYSYAASEAFNMIFSGGKEDDITCVVIMMTPGP